MVMETRAASRRKAGLDPKDAPAPTQLQGSTKRIATSAPNDNQEARPVKKRQLGKIIESSSSNKTAKVAAAAPKTAKATAAAPKKAQARPRVAARHMCFGCHDSMDISELTTCHGCNVKCCHECINYLFTLGMTSKPLQPVLCFQCRSPFQIFSMPGQYTKEYDTDAVQKYLQDLEEYISPPPLYCPVPQCSTFIPQRLYAEPRITAMQVYTNMRYGTGGPGSASSDFFSIFKTTRQASACCPKCVALVCTGCRQSYHGDTPCEVPKSELGHLENIKACPFCTNAVEHAGGCPIVSCACGRYFCFICGAWPCTCQGSPLQAPPAR